MLEIRDLEISFFSGKKQTRRTDRVSFSVRPGEILALVGESGCGKSITALSVLGLLAQDPRPSYQNDPQRVYGVAFGGYDFRFRVQDGILTVCEVEKLN